MDKSVIENQGYSYLNNYVPVIDGEALIVVDIQNDFLPGGALAAQEGDEIISDTNQVIKGFRDNKLQVVLTQDWHPDGHHSFASVHDGKQPFDPYDAPGLGPVLWPDHCIQNSFGSEFPISLDDHNATAIIRKGYNKEIDSYSGFLENDFQTETGLHGFLDLKAIDEVFICGLAYDYCVYFTALDAVKKGYTTYLITDLTQPVGAPEGIIEIATKNLYEYGVHFIESNQLQF